MRGKARRILLDGGGALVAAALAGALQVAMAQGSPQKSSVRATSTDSALRGKTGAPRRGRTAGTNRCNGAARRTRCIRCPGAGRPDRSGRTDGSRRPAGPDGPSRSSRTSRPRPDDGSQDHGGRQHDHDHAPVRIRSQPGALREHDLQLRVLIPRFRSETSGTSVSIKTYSWGSLSTA